MNRCSNDHLKGNKMKNSETVSKCDCTTIHEDVVNNVKSKMPEEESLIDLADLFKTFGDSTRIKILYALFEGELCVGDLATILQLSQPAISHQLKVLKDAKLVKLRREGKVIFYSLDDDHVRSILSIGMNHIEE